MVASAGRRFILTSKGRHETLEGSRVSAGFLRALGVKPMLGRDFSLDEYSCGRSSGGLMSYGLWRRRFGGESEILGKTITLDGKPYSVVGVLSANFKLPSELESNLASFYRSSVELLVPLKPGIGIRG